MHDAPASFWYLRHKNPTAWLPSYANCDRSPIICKFGIVSYLAYQDKALRIHLQFDQIQYLSVNFLALSGSWGWQVSAHTVEKLAVKALIVAAIFLL